MNDQTLVLGSSSPRRKEILTVLGVPFIIQETPFFDNPTAEAGTPQEIVERIAQQKMEALMETGATGILITADTIVVVDDILLGKPKDETDAFRMLTLLSGKKHSVRTAVCLKGGKLDLAITWSEQADVYFRDIEEPEIHSYIKHCQPFDKAGAYGIQDKAAAFIEKIDGEYYTVLGLPVVSLVQNLKKAGVTIF